MRVLHIISSMDPRKGGVSLAVRTIIESLKESPHFHEVVTLDSSSEPTYDVHDDFKIYKLGPGKTPWLFAPALKRWLEMNIERFDILIVHGLWQYHTYASYQIWRKMRPKTKLFVMPHGMLDPYFQRAKGRRLKALRNDLIWALNEKRLINECDGLLFTCELEKTLAKEAFVGYNAKKQYVTGLGVAEVEAFNQKMEASFLNLCDKFKSNSRFFLFLGRIDAKKGVDILIKTYMKLQVQIPDLPALVIAGPGLETNYGQMIKCLASASNNIFFPGMLSGAAKWGAFYKAELFILPSHQENFGIAIVESLACGTPVLISNKVNIWKEIKDGGGGIVVDDSEEGCLQGLKEWIRKSSDEVEAIKNRARRTFIKYFSIDEFGNRMQSFLEKEQQ